MSGAQTSSFYPVNQLLVDNAQQIANQYAPQRNALFVQRAQQEIGGTEIEMLARASQHLMSAYKTPEERAAAYPQIVAGLQANGFAKQAPSVYPGDDRIAAIASLGISAADQYKLRGNTHSNLGLLGDGGTTTAPTGGAVAPGAGGGRSTLTPFVASNPKQPLWTV